MSNVSRITVARGHGSGPEIMNVNRLNFTVRELSDSVIECHKIVTRQGSGRTCRYAFEYAPTHRVGKPGYALAQGQ